METKVCSRCGVEKPIDEFYQIKRPKPCKECNRAAARQWRLDNPEKARQTSVTDYQTHKDRYKARAKAWKEANPDKVQESRQRTGPEYERRNAERRREQRRERYRERYQTDPHYVARRRLQSSLRQALRFASTKKTVTTFGLIGCPIQDLVKHLEAQFQPGMSWDRLGEIEIDHIVPIASFDLSDPEQQKKCFHYTNLRPLWREDNRKKGAKIIG